VGSATTLQIGLILCPIMKTVRGGVQVRVAVIAGAIGEATLQSAETFLRRSPLQAADGNDI